MKDGNSRNQMFSTAERALTVSLQASMILMIVKLLAGHFGHSDAVFADGLESATDLLATAAGMATLKIGGRPIDSDHPYGPARRKERIAVLAAVVTIATSAASRPRRRTSRSRRAGASCMSRCVKGTASQKQAEAILKVYEATVQTLKAQLDEVRAGARKQDIELDI